MNMASYRGVMNEYGFICSSLRTVMRGMNLFLLRIWAMYERLALFVWGREDERYNESQACSMSDWLHL